MTTLFKLRKVLFAVPLLAVFAAWALQPTSSAAAAPESASTTVASDVMPAGLVAIDPSLDAMAPSGNCTYYMDPGHMMVVGQFGYDCCNNPVAWGMTTPYSTCGGCFICFPPPR